MSKNEVRHIPIYCDCCVRHSERLATIIDNGKDLKLSIYTKRHGKIHYFSEKISALVQSCGITKGETDGTEKT